MKPTVSVTVDLAALVEDHGPRRWVERRKELVLGIDLRPREPVEKRRLASIRVAHQRHAVDSRVPARLALDPAPHLEPLELPAEVGDLVPHQATVNLKLALALAKAAADSTPGLLADEVAPHAPKARQDVLELRKLHLQASLARPSMNAKDVEDERGSVDDLDRLANDALEVGLLGGGELLIKDDDVRIHVADVAHQLLDLALANERLRHGSVEPLAHGEDHLGPVSLRKARKLCERFLARPVGPAEVDAHKNCALGHRRRADGLEPVRRPAHLPPPSSSWPAPSPETTSSQASSVESASMSRTLARPSRLIQESCRLA